MASSATQSILDTWLALEVLEAGAQYNKLGDLENGSSRKTVKLAPELPWDGGLRKHTNAGYKVYYEVILGSIKLDEANVLLYESFPDVRPERSSSKRFAPLATFLVSSEGTQISDDAITLSSFCWAFPQALRKHFSKLRGWPRRESQLKKSLTEILFIQDDMGKPLPVTSTILQSAYLWLVQELGLEIELCIPPAYAFCVQCFSTKKEPPELLLLNSFYIEDLVKAGSLNQKRNLPALVSWYLNEHKKSSTISILNEPGALEEILAPSRFPHARWPGQGHFPLTTLQQAAVNLVEQTPPGEILAVNGPPGTGKTTLLRDVIATLVEARASRMVEFDDPEKAFVQSDVEVPLGSFSTKPYSVEQRLRGFEILVASSNNKAVENVSRELPAINAIAEDATKLRYFQTVSNALFKVDTWGLIAAVLGNSGNRKDFKDRFWFDQDTGMQPYLQFITGKRDFPVTGGLPQVVRDEDPPLNHTEALSRWRKTRKRFIELQKSITALFEKREELRRRLRLLPALLELIIKRELLAQNRPGFCKRLFRLRSFLAWKAQDASVCAELHKILQIPECVIILSDPIQEYLHEASLGKFRKLSRYSQIRDSIASQVTELETEIQGLRFEPFTDHVWDSDRDHAQIIGPWFSAEEQLLRDELFQVALSVHRAFIDAAAKPLKTNIAFALKLLDGEQCYGMSDDLAQDMLSSLFFTVPCISTTFASVNRMLANVPVESIGWLIVDEAGQAKPQQAIGALLRAKRALIVGDPLQIPPVVGMPEGLIEAISSYLGVEYSSVCAPVASVQTMADRANRYIAQFSSSVGERSVGVPLLVHRRCSEPMFSISNQIAYENQMVLAKVEKPSPIRMKLGLSRWVHIQGYGTNKWCMEEGAFVLQQCEELVRSHIELNLYIVSPFVQVAEGLRTLFRESEVLAIAINDLYSWTLERIGTVHTVQGREAEAVFFVLGAPNEDQRGARAWAGGSPNLINVAVTRAKECLYVVGNAELWKKEGLFGDLFYLLERFNRAKDT